MNSKSRQVMVKAFTPASPDAFANTIGTFTFEKYCCASKITFKIQIIFVKPLDVSLIFKTNQI